MNPKRRADLQRKLTLNAVPRPPEGLADRIKADIPKYLEVDTERARFSRSVAFNMRIAASILLLLTTAVATVYLVAPREEVMTASTSNKVAVFAPTARNLPRAQDAPTDEVRLEIAQEPEIPAELSEIPQIAAGARPMSIPQPTSVAPARQDERARREEVSIADTEAKTVAAEEDAAAPQSVLHYAAEVGSVPAPAVAPPPPSAAGAARKAVMAEAITVNAQAPAVSVMRAQASNTTATAPLEVFGISVDPAAFQRIRETLEDGNRPASSAVDVEAIVNYFAATAASTPRRGVRLEVEASPAAIEAEGDHAILRFTIDTAKADTPVAEDARIEVEFDTDVVKRATRIGSTEGFATQSVLLANTSVTGLYALELQPNLRSSQTVASVRLHYKSVPEGRKQTITKMVKAGDLAQSWSRATRRHRLASLGALWGETLKGNAGGDAVAQRAEELATQKPDDPLARDLARAASASAGGR